MLSVRNNYIQESAIFVHRLQNFLVEAYRKRHLRLNADLADAPGIIYTIKNFKINIYQKEP